MSRPQQQTDVYSFTALKENFEGRELDEIRLCLEIFF